MLRDSRYSPTHSSGSSGGNGYVVSVNICGRGDVHQGDPPAHWEVMLRKRGETDGDLYRVRKNENFYYEDPVQTRAVESATSYGRNEIQHLSDSSKETAARVLNTYGKDKSNLPHRSASSQEWTVGALGALEREKLVPQGTRDYWSQNIGQASSEVGARLRREGGSWVPSPPVYYKGRGPADATSGKEQVRQPVNRYNLDEFAGLSSSSKSRR
ncbi:hypothetical protein N7536_004309 [Penicillium majusculum]|uniref:Uncharacterized protein n=1 Tax=Penicillium solitum TaxID=60172 RepID=A0A1V6QM25_9EURO|nr:uncharacterized protein PENSOL_c058G00033 [Penicillium solitum]KAJ5693897.1 hypothetical protein N7536_004309 [Penicillium majusculum]OQD90308.1 hypothetical protein PENSOL_c058G00033 [Penicillium solitum]